MLESLLCNRPFRDIWIMMSFIDTLREQSCITPFCYDVGNVPHCREPLRMREVYVGFSFSVTFFGLVVRLRASELAKPKQLTNAVS